MKRRQKFNARPAYIGARKFDSELEATCWALAYAVEQANPGVLVVELKPRFLLLSAQTLPSGRKERASHYTADFALHLKRKGIRVVIEVKSAATKAEPAYILRRKLLYFIHKVEVVEVTCMAALQTLLRNLLRA